MVSLGWLVLLALWWEWGETCPEDPACQDCSDCASDCRYAAEELLAAYGVARG